MLLDAAEYHKDGFFNMELFQNQWFRQLLPLRSTSCTQSAILAVHTLSAATSCNRVASRLQAAAPTPTLAAALSNELPVVVPLLL